MAGSEPSSATSTELHRELTTIMNWLRELCPPILILAQESGRRIGLAEDRIYASFAEMAAKEAAREDGIQAVSIVTPNHLHFAPAKAFLEAGIHVICDKPLTSTLDEARALAKIKPKNGAKFLLTHNYTGYPLVRQARAMVANGDLGKIRVVQVEYPQDWLTRRPFKQAGGLAHGSCSFRTRRCYRRYRYARL